MTSKTTTGKGFKGVFNYLLQEEKKATILELNGVSRNDAKGLTREFEVIVQENRNISKPVYHTSLSFHSDDKITDEKMKEIANKFLEKMGFTKDNQYVIVKHGNTQHSHIHIVANRINFDGQVVSDYYCKNRAVSAAKQLEREYNLEKVQEIAKERRFINEKAKQFDLTRTELKSKIENSLKRHEIHSLQDLQKELKKSGIEMNILKHSKNGEPYGISFTLNNQTIKGSDLGKKYSYKALSENIKPNQLVINNLTPAVKAISTTIKIIKRGIELGI